MAKKVVVKKSPVATKPARATANAKVAAKPVGKAVKVIKAVKAVSAAKVVKSVTLKPSGLKATSVKASALKSGGAKGNKRGGTSAPLGEGVPASRLQVMRVMGNALITTEKKKLTLDAGVARAVAAPLFPGDKPAASAFIKLLQTAVKDLEKSAALSAMTTPLL